MWGNIPRPAFCKMFTSFHISCRLIGILLKPVTQTRHSGMDAGIQSQGREILSRIAPESRHDGVTLLPSTALETGGVSAPQGHPLVKVGHGLAGKRLVQ
jgi:hypothetical protein